MQKLKKKKKNSLYLISFCHFQSNLQNTQWIKKKKKEHA